jgi:hypothetical protein
LLGVRVLQVWTESRGGQQSKNAAASLLVYLREDEVKTVVGNAEYLKRVDR